MNHKNEEIFQSKRTIQDLRDQVDLKHLNPSQPQFTRQPQVTASNQPQVTGMSQPQVTQEDEYPDGKFQCQFEFEKNLGERAKCVLLGKTWIPNCKSMKAKRSDGYCKKHSKAQRKRTRENRSKTSAQEVVLLIFLVACKIRHPPSNPNSTSTFV